MSDNPELALIIASFEAYQVGTYFQVAAAGLLAYEYVITFGREVDLFWKRKATMASVLFGVNRYLPMVVAALDLPYPVSPSMTYAVRAAYTNAISVILQYLPWAVFSALRAYVLSSRTWMLAILVFLLSMASPVVNFVVLSWATVIYEPGVACALNVDLSRATQQIIVSRTSLITSDFLVLAITWVAIYKTRGEIKALGQSTSLADIMFRDGAVLLLMNVIHLSFSMVSISTADLSKQSSSAIVLLSEPLTAILISRFLMNLQEANNTMMHQECFSSVGTLNFNRFIGSIASSLPAPGDASERTRYEEDDRSWDGGPAGCSVEGPSGSSTGTAR
ncbi:hypothetical protein C8Q76DRAFT_719703 [Earliella scabrosa]|nr:hypothetical protein C8Q76DRAFT_719703 [Earliella scabrosa]